MKQLDKAELFVCSEDWTSQIGFADKVEIWSEGGGSTIILRGINASRNDLLQAENECLRKDVEFYKNRVLTVQPQPEVDESKFIEALEDYAEGRVSHVDVAEVMAVTLIESEPTEAERLAWLINGHINPGGITPESLAEYLIAHGVKAGAND